MEDLIKLQRAQIEALQKELKRKDDLLTEAKTLLTEIFKDAKKNS